MDIKGETTYLTVPHGRKEITFRFPAFYGSIENVTKSIDQAGLRRPSSPEIASLVYSTFQNPNGESESEIIRILNEGWLLEFTGNLYLPKSNGEVSGGVIVEYNPKVEKGRAVMDRDSLVERLNNNDPNVRFVPFGFKTRKQSPRELEMNPYIIARYGEEGAESIAAAASRYKSGPFLWSFDSVDKEIVKMSALGGGWGFDDWLVVDGYGWNLEDSVRWLGVYES